MPAAWVLTKFKIRSMGLSKHRVLRMTDQFEPQSLQRVFLLRLPGAVLIIDMADGNKLDRIIL